MMEKMFRNRRKPSIAQSDKACNLGPSFQSSFRRALCGLVLVLAANTVQAANVAPNATISGSLYTGTLSHLVDGSTSTTNVVNMHTYQNDWNDYSVVYFDFGSGGKTITQFRVHQAGNWDVDQRSSAFFRLIASNDQQNWIGLADAQLQYTSNIWVQAGDYLTGNYRYYAVVMFDSGQTFTDIDISEIELID